MNPKDSIRQMVLKKRDAIPLDIRKAKDRAVKERFFSLKEFKEAGVILFYASFRSEVGTLDMISEALSSSMEKRVMLPRVDAKGRTLKIYEIKAMAELVKGYMGIPEPPENSESLRTLSEIDLVLMPGAAFDINGGRLGYGKGYYDKMLSTGGAMPPFIALAYEEQIVDYIPVRPHDIGVDAIITDERIIWTKGRLKKA